MPHPFEYDITPTDKGVILSIWEPAPKNEIRVRPFLFMVKCRLLSEVEARKLLAHYLTIYQTQGQTLG
ncbi:MAG: hypothetical protein MUF49_11950 [Oculatellaceae cyanobacterium Prado106]|jgi:hypothetical protein|nr:hypothetical protein [Oculatellaceae cyanobacterium Prado106]